MKDWLIGSAILISAALVTAGVLFLFGCVMWALDLPPDEYSLLTLIGGIGALVAGYWWFDWLLKKLNQRSWDKVLKR